MSSYSHGTLGWWMDERRGELGMTWDQVAETAGVSTETLYRWGRQQPRRVQTTKKKAVERALQWERGSIDAILRGGEPTEATADDVDDVGTIDLKDPRDDYEEEVVASSLSRREKREIIADWRVTVAERKRMLRARAESHSNRAEASNDADTAR